ncbi:MAG: acylneuraminate cytidylyltransferase family protein [Clostridiales bacterium]|nr:acylneuraminate cytidylyltransferase family protein [Clostridiales bacterium]
MTPLYIIPARGGSRGIPHKNIKELDGKPLIAYSIEAAREAGADDSHILVSTDDPAIKAVVEDCCGLTVPFLRPDSLATDISGSREVILHAMDQADEMGIAYDVVVLLQPTSPLRVASDILGAISLFHAGIDMVVSVTEAPCNPYYDCFECDPATGVLQVSKGDGLITRRQDAPHAWVYNGAVYVISPESIRNMPLGAFPSRLPYVMPKERSIDLDTPLDWIVAQAIIDSNKAHE